LKESAGSGRREAGGDLDGAIDGGGVGRVIREEEEVKSVVKEGAMMVEGLGEEGRGEEGEEEGWGGGREEADFGGRRRRVKEGEEERREGGERGKGCGGGI